jgi:site-specific recombinase XerD
VKVIEPMEGASLAELLLSTMESFVLSLDKEQLSGAYLSSARRIIGELALFCGTEPASNPWQRRQDYLDRRGELRALEPFSKNYLQGHGRELSHFLRWLTALGDGKIEVAELPDELRRPLLDYLEHLVEERELVKKSIQNILRPTLELCRHLHTEGEGSFASLRIKHIDETVSTLVTAPLEDMLRRRQQVQNLNSCLRGFLRYLHERGLIKRDPSTAIISPPCYRASRVSQALSEQEVQSLLDSVDRGHAKGRRTYAIVMLITTYGLRPVDVSRLELDDLSWRNERIAIIQSKTRLPVTLPLLPEVAEALYEYLRHDRYRGVSWRHVFLSLTWPHRPLRPNAISEIVKGAMRAVAPPHAVARRLRQSAAVHLQRQGASLSTIQEILGHRIPETTQRYAVTDPVLLRQVLDEEER